MIPTYRKTLSWLLTFLFSEAKKTININRQFKNGNEIMILRNARNPYFPLHSSCFATHNANLPHAKGWKIVKGLVLLKLIVHSWSKVSFSLLLEVRKVFQVSSDMYIYLLFRFWTAPCLQSCFHRNPLCVCVCVGVMAGFNMSSDLQRPEHNIPVGTLAAVCISYVSVSHRNNL